MPKLMTDEEFQGYVDNFKNELFPSERTASFIYTMAQKIIKLEKQP